MGELSYGLPNIIEHHRALVKDERCWLNAVINSIIGAKWTRANNTWVDQKARSDSKHSKDKRGESGIRIGAIVVHEFRVVGHERGLIDARQCVMEFLEIDIDLIG